MTDRKYGQRGYRDSEKESGGRSSSGPRQPGMLTSRTAFAVPTAGTLLPSLTDGLGQCPKCRAELHACQQCTHFAPGQGFECSQAIPERIADKRARNDCTFFSLRATVERETSSGSGSRPDDPRRALNDLFKK
jgi:hypothetical protein